MQPLRTATLQELCERAGLATEPVGRSRRARQRARAPALSARSLAL